MNSQFITSLIGSLSGAFAGAFTAQRIVERSKLRDELIREIRNTNAAIAVAFGICNSLLSLKNQYVKDLKSNYDSQKTEQLEHARKLESGEITSSEIFEYKTNLVAFQAHKQPTEILSELVFEKLSLTGRSLNLVIALIQNIHGHYESIRKRENIIEDYKSLEAKGKQDMIAALYFGLPYGDGHINSEYPSLIKAISTQTDDGIFFSKLLCQDLSKHGKQLLETLKKNFRNVNQSVTEIDFAKAESHDLMPDDKNYADWLSAFEKK